MGDYCHPISSSSLGEASSGTKDPAPVHGTRFKFLLLTTYTAEVIFFLVSILPSSAKTSKEKDKKLFR
jgi:hypothetical protein